MDFLLALSEVVVLPLIQFQKIVLRYLEIAGPWAWSDMLFKSRTDLRFKSECSGWWMINNLVLALEALNMYSICYINKILFSLPRLQLCRIRCLWTVHWGLCFKTSITKAQEGLVARNRISCTSYKLKGGNETRIASYTSNVHFIYASISTGLALKIWHTDWML